MWCWRRLQSPLDSKEIKPVNLKGNQPWILIGRRTDAEAEAPVFWSPDANSWSTGKVPDAQKDWGQEEKRAPEDEMTRWHHWCNGHELGQTLGDGEGQGGLECCSPWSCKESDMIGRLKNNKDIAARGQDIVIQAKGELSRSRTCSSQKVLMRGFDISGEIWGNLGLIFLGSQADGRLRERSGENSLFFSHLLFLYSRSSRPHRILSSGDVQTS